MREAKVTAVLEKKEKIVFFFHIKMHFCLFVGDFFVLKLINSKLKFFIIKILATLNTLDPC